MHVDHVRVGEDGEERVEVAQVRRRLENPAVAVLPPLPLLPLEELEHPPQVLVGRREVLLVEPGSIGRHVTRRLGNVGEKRIRQEHDLLVGLVGVGRVDRRTARGRTRASVGRGPRRRRCADPARPTWFPAGAQARRPPTPGRSSGGGRGPAPAAAASFRNASCRPPRADASIRSSAISGCRVNQSTARRRARGCGGSTPAGRSSRSR